MVHLKQCVANMFSISRRIKVSRRPFEKHALTTDFFLLDIEKIKMIHLDLIGAFADSQRLVVHLNSVPTLVTISFILLVEILPQDL